MNLEGKIGIRMRLGSGGVEALEIASSRLLHLAQALRGRPMTEAAQLVPRLFSLCGTAQAEAAALACEQAAGLPVPPATAARRTLLVTMEGLREHLWRMLLDWPPFYGSEPQREVLAQVLRLAGDYRLALVGDADPFLPGAEVAEPDAGAIETALQQMAELLQRDIFGLTPNEWLQLADAPALTQWAWQRETPPARLIRHIAQRGWEGSGACRIAPLPRLDASALAQAMDAPEFIALPQWRGQCCETGSLPRTDTLLLRALRQDHGNGLLPRVAARLGETALLWQQLKTGKTKPRPASAAHNPGIGQSAAARGQLVHRVTLAQDRVEDYRILAPTEWNFHPQGVVARALATLHGDRLQIEQQARLLINVIDPCVAYELQIDHA